MLDVKKKQIELHKRIADKYRIRYESKFSKLYQDYHNAELTRYLPKDDYISILDCGCGTGIVLEFLRRKYRHVFGFDLSFEMLDRLDPLYKDRILVADAEELPFVEGTFDAVVCRGILHHLPAPSKALEEIARSLRPGGFLIVSEPSNDMALVRFIRKIMYKKNTNFDVNERPFISKELGTLIREKGFLVKDKRFFGYAAYAFAGFPDILPVLRYMPFNVLITRFLILLDRCFQSLPILNRCGLHVIYFGQKI